MRIALTGATGFVGSAVLEAAGAAGVPVQALARRPQAGREGVRWLAGDLADRSALARLCEGADALLHVAAMTRSPTPRGFEEANVIGTQTVLEAARAAGIARFVFVSSLAAREPGLSAYGASKARAERLVAASGTDWTVVRPPGVYGPRDRDYLEMFRMARRWVVPLPPPGRSSLIHVADLARLLLALAGGDSSPAGQTYEPDDGQTGGWSHRELAQLIAQAVGRPRAVKAHLPRSLLRIGAALDERLRGEGARLTADRASYMAHPDWVASPDRKPPPDLWQPRIPTPEGLAATARWYREAGWL